MSAERAHCASTRKCGGRFLAWVMTGEHTQYISNIGVTGEHVRDSQQALISRGYEQMVY